MYSLLSDSWEGWAQAVSQSEFAWNVNKEPHADKMLLPANSDYSAGKMDYMGRHGS